jgi:fatty acid desaturase
MRTTKLQFRWHILNGLLFQPVVARDVLYNDIRYTLMQYRLGRPFFKQAYREFIILIVVQVVLAVINWQKFLLYIYVPHFFAQWAIVSINLLQHDGCDGSVAGVNCARNFTGKVLNFLLMNNGYHTIHHIKPWTHWSHLPEIHAKEIHPTIHPALEQSSMLEYIWQTFFWPGQRVTFDGRPMTGEIGPDEDWVKDFYPKDPSEREKLERMTGNQKETFGSILLALFSSMFVSAGSLFGPE